MAAPPGRGAFLPSEEKILTPLSARVCATPRRPRRSAPRARVRWRRRVGRTPRGNDLASGGGDPAREARTIPTVDSRVSRRRRGGGGRSGGREGSDEGARRARRSRRREGALPPRPDAVRPKGGRAFAAQLTERPGRLDARSRGITGLFP